jgi:hypothetical protein
MKTIKLIISGLVLALITVSCVKKEPTFPLEGTWKMIYGDWMSSDGSTFPAQIEGSQIKTWTKFNFTFVGQFTKNEIADNAYGAGDYSLDGNRYTEKMIYHYQKVYLDGGDLRLFIEFKKDTLIQRWPVDKNWKLPKKHCTEKYIRIYK